MRSIAALLPAAWLATALPDTPVVDWYSPAFIATQSKQAISLRGHVYSHRHAKRLADTASGLGLEPVIVELQRHVILPDWWRPATIESLGVLDALYSGEVRIQADALLIRGAVEDDVDLEALIGSVGDALPDDIDLQTDITVVAVSNVDSICDKAFAALDLSPLYFDGSSTEIRPENAGRLNRLAATMRRCPKIEMNITGHADALGTSAGILLASEARAQAVQAYLSERGVAPDRLRASGRGASEPAGNNATWEGRNQNRRVEFARLFRD